MRWLLVVASVAAISCKAKASEPSGGAPSSTEVSPDKAAASKFTLTEAGDETNKVTVELVVPSTWRAAPAATFTADGAVMLSLANVSATGSDAASRVEKAIKRQFEDVASATRKDYPDGRVWFAQPQNENVHARMFVPYAGGVVMGIAVLSDKAKLEGVRSTFETLTIAK